MSGYKSSELFKVFQKVRREAEHLVVALNVLPDNRSGGQIGLVDVKKIHHIIGFGKDQMRRVLAQQDFQIVQQVAMTLSATESIYQVIVVHRFPIRLL